MYKIAFFCIPAYGHTNPTLEVVRQLTSMGNEVWYYSYELFKEKIEATGARFIPCDEYDFEMDLKPEDATRVGKDIGFSIHILTETTLALDEMVCKSLGEFEPDCVIADSMAVWGKFAAQKLKIPFISSTTTFAFNRYSAKIMKQSLSQMFSLIKAMPSVNRDIKRLQEKDYPVKNLLSIMQNDNDTHTIVYTSKEFQPCSETFSKNYVFVGPSIQKLEVEAKRTDRKTIYISLGTVNNNMPKFFKNCITAFRDSEYNVIMSIGNLIEITELGEIPENFTIQNQVNQIEVLQCSDVFLSHCGMNSVNESLYYGVPLILFPQTSEQGGVANRVAQMNAGVFLKKDRVDAIKEAVNSVVKNSTYKENASKISESFKKAGGAKKAANAIVDFIKENKE